MLENYDSRAVIYARRGFIRLATGQFVKIESSNPDQDSNNGGVYFKNIFLSYHAFSQLIN